MMSASVRDLERSSHVPGAMIYADVGESLAVARPRGKGYLVLVRRGAWPDDDVEAAAVRSDRRQTTPRMSAPARPAEDDRAPVRRPRWMDALGCASTSEQALQPAPVHVHDPEPIVDSSRPSATEDDPAVAGAPAHARTVSRYLADLVQIAAVAVHHQQRADIRALRDFMANESNAPAVARPSGGVLASRRQLLEAAVRVATIDTGCGGKPGTRYDDRAGLSSRLALAGSR